MKWLMERKQFVLIIGVALLFLFVLMVGFHFFKEEEVKPNISKDPVVLPEDDELEFSNESSLSGDEVWKLVEEKKEVLRSLFYESKVYEPHEIDATRYTISDNDHYVVFDQDFIKNLNQIVTEDIYNTILSELTVIKDQYYIAEKDIFNSVYLNSAIAEVDVLSSEIRLVMATDEFINANVSIQICEEDDHTCNHDFNVPFELQKVGNDWKVSSFQNH